MTYTVLAAALAFTQTPSLENIGFAKGSLVGWEGQGFTLTKDSPAAVSSADEVNAARKGMVRHVLVVPPGTRTIRFGAYLLQPPEHEPDGRLNVVLAGEKNQVVPKYVRTPSGWTPAPNLLSRWQGKPREYMWDVSAHGGRVMQIVIFDRDERPDCFVYCTGFTLEKGHLIASKEASPRNSAAPSDKEFALYIAKLEKDHKLAPMARFDSKRFTAMGNAAEGFMVERVRNCEAIYDLFFDHFTRKGFTLHQPADRLMLAIFDSPAGFDAYLGRKMPAGVTGLFHTGTNRLVFYDQSENQFIADQKKQAQKVAAKLSSSLDRTRFIDSVTRQFDNMSKDLTLTTVMHEAAHQLSFNCGLLNRAGDVPLWLAEGLACYCEATDNGEWQALGALNPGRIDDLRRAKGKYLALEALLKDNWRDSHQVLVGYAQSWALFRMLMHERPKELRAYLALLYARRTPDYRLADFREAFGGDLAALDRGYQAYLHEVAGKR